jgi:hypothetical protein
MFPIIYTVNYFVFQLLVNKLSLRRPNKLFVLCLSLLIIAPLSFPPWPIISFSTNQINGLKSRNFHVTTEITHEEIVKNPNFPTFVIYKYEVAIHNQSRSTYSQIPIDVTLVLTDTNTGEVVQHFFGTSERSVQNINPGTNLVRGELSLPQDFKTKVGNDSQIQLSVVFDQYPYNSPFEGAFSKSYLNQTKLNSIIPATY